MTTKQIGQKAVTAIEQQISKDSYLESYIDRDGSFPSWDGHILVYSNQDCKKENLSHKVPVQVKGKTVKKFSGKNTSFPMEIADLRNYQRDGGVFLLVVQIIDSDNTKIYYTSLCPVDLDILLESTNETNAKKPTKNIAVKELNISNKSALRFLLINFMNNRIRQIGRTILKDDDLHDICEVNFTISTDSKNFNQYLLENEIYIYGKKNSSDPFSPLHKGRIEAIFETVKNLVSIKEKVFYNEYIIKHTQETDILKLGKATEIDLTSHKIKFIPNGNIYDRVKDLEFLLDLFEYGRISCGGIVIAADNIKKAHSKIPQYKGVLLAFRKVIELFDYFEVDFNVEFEKLTEIDIKNLNMLVNLIINHKRPKKLFKNSGPFVIPINNFKLAIMVLHKEDGEYDVYNYFGDLHKYVGFGFVPEGETERIVLTPYIQLESSEMLSISNFNVRAIMDSIKQYPLVEQSAVQVNLFLLKVINAYDESKRQEIWELALYVANVLAEFDSSDIFMINKLQIIKRCRPLTSDEKDILYKIREQNSNDKMIQVGVAILLENHSDYERQFTSLNNEEQALFMSYPIYWFVNH